MGHKNASFCNYVEINVNDDPREYRDKYQSSRNYHTLSQSGVTRADAQPGYFLSRGGGASIDPVRRMGTMAPWRGSAPEKRLSISFCM